LILDKSGKKKFTDLLKKYCQSIYDYLEKYDKI